MGRVKESKKVCTPKPTLPVPKTEEVRIEKIDGVSPRKEAPSIPTVLVDGGMLYRFLLELRRDYDSYINADEKEDVKLSKKRAIQVIDKIMDYIMRMDKKEEEPT